MQGKLINLFDAAEKISLNSLFVVHNSAVTKMKVSEIFDAERYTDFKAVSYVSSPKFFAETVKDFKSVTFILGIDNVDNLNKFSDGFSAYFNSEENIKFFNDLPDETKNLVVENNIKIRYGKPGVMIHDKIYLLANEETEDFRVIIGSANFSTSAFNSENKNFENIRIDDSKILYEIYLERFNYLLQQTSDYIPEICRRSYKKEKVIVTISPETNVEILLDKFKSNDIKLVVTEEQMEIFNQRAALLDAEKQNIDSAKKIIEVAVETKSKDGVFKIKPLSKILDKKNILREIFYKIPKKKNVENDIREVLLMDANNYKLYKRSAENKEFAPLYSKKIDAEKIKTTLEKINAFTQAYFDFAVTPNEIIPAKIYELILYAFTAPFIWKIRQKCAMLYDKSAVSDIPIFCILGGVRESGKTTALRFAATLLGQTDGKQIYDYGQELDTAKIIYSMIKENNLMPIFADEMSLKFFQRSSSAYKGEEMIKSLANEIPSAPVGTLIGTTNLTDFSSSGQVIRRIYFLEVSSMFDSKRKRESVDYLNEIYAGIDDELFKDFTFRFSQAICDNAEIFGIEDFLKLTRKIFLSYYEESGVEVPKYFPREIFSDYEGRKIETWRRLFFANKNCFIDNGEIIQVNIDEIFKNSTNVKAQKDKLINFLDETCIETVDTGVNWFLKKDEFYKFIDYQPSFVENIKNSVQKFLN